MPPITALPALAAWPERHTEHPLPPPPPGACPYPVTRDVPQQPSSLLVAAEELSADSTNGDVQIALTQAAPYTTPRALYSTSLVPYAPNPQSPRIPAVHRPHVFLPYILYTIYVPYSFYRRSTRSPTCALLALTLAPTLGSWVPWLGSWIPGRRRYNSPRRRPPSARAAPLNRWTRAAVGLAPHVSSLDPPYPLPLPRPRTL